MSNDAMLYANEHNIDKEKLKRMLPKGSSHKVTDEIINLIGSMEKDTGLIQDYLEESFLSHLPVLREVRVDLKDYVNAIKYCNLKRGMTNEKAWEIVFPERYKKLHDEKRWNSSHVSMYNSSNLVVKIDAQMQIATHIQYAPFFHESIMVQYKLMMGSDAHGNDTSAHIQHLAAAKLADLTQAPVEQKIDLKIGQSDEAKNSNAKMLAEMDRIAKNQQELLRQGHSIEEVQKLNLVIDVEEDDGEDEYRAIVE